VPLGEKFRLGRALGLLALIFFGPFNLAGAQAPAELQQQGVQAFHAGEFAVAERLFSELVRVNPSAMAFSYLATAEGAMGEYRQASSTFESQLN
jgi:hypothetical protein